MTSKFVRILVAALFSLSLIAWAQTAPAGTAASPATGTKVGTISIEGAIFGSNEGRRDIDVLTKKLEPKQTELKTLSDEVDSLKKQLSTQGDKMNEDSAATLRKQVDSKQKVF